MEIKKLQEMLRNQCASMQDYQEWELMWETYINGVKDNYESLSYKEAVARLISEYNYRERAQANNCGELGVDIKVGDICYIDFGCAYVNEIGYQHFGLILSIFHNKAFVIPMSGNQTAYHSAYAKDNPEGKEHLMRLGKLKGMNKNSVLFMNDAKWINTARIIEVKAHLDRQGELFQEIKARVIHCLNV